MVGVPTCSVNRNSAPAQDTGAQRLETRGGLSRYREVEKNQSGTSEALSRSGIYASRRAWRYGRSRRVALVAGKQENKVCPCCPTDPNDYKKKRHSSRFEEATAVEEASLFAADLFRMYARFAERRAGRVEAGPSVRVARRAGGGYKFRKS